MDWLDRLNCALEYIEAHLTDEINFEHAAKIACCSTFHFQRMFSYIADMPLSEYIRRRKMSKAAADIKNGTKVIDAALKYGYESPTAFNRAFQSIHGIAPSKAKAECVILKAYPPISFKITIKGEIEMNYKIETKETFRIVGVKTHFTGGIEESFQTAPSIWQKAHTEGSISKLCSMMDTDLKGIMGICTAAPQQEFDYYIGVATTQEIPEAMEEFIVPASTWAVFDCTGKIPEAIQTLQKRIITEWLPTSGYEYANSPDIELYFEGDQSAEDYHCQVWLPVRKK